MAHPARFSRQSGFTLLEAVISLLLLAVLSVMSYQGVEVVLGANERSRSALADEAELHRAWQTISRDFLHIRPRAFADGLGSVERAYLTDPSEFGVRFSRGVGLWCVPTRRVSAVSNTVSTKIISLSDAHGR